MTPTVAVVGLAQEAPCQLLLQALAEVGARALAVDQQQMQRWPLDWQVDEHGLQGHCNDTDLQAIAGLYLRPMDPRAVWPDDPAQALAGQQWNAAWTELAELLPARVANPASAMASNASKPYQALALQAAGFAVPPTLITDDPQAVLDFEDRHGELIFKSASGQRSIVRVLDAAARQRLPQLRHCPTMFQQRLRGTNVRVHVVGEQVFCTEIDCEGVDYRYAARDGLASELRATQLDAQTQWRCIRVAHALGLPFAGLDLMLADDGQTYCFEVNPSPGYSYYEDATGQPIARALALWLSGQV